MNTQSQPSFLQSKLDTMLNKTVAAPSPTEYTFPPDSPAPPTYARPVEKNSTAAKEPVSAAVKTSRRDRFLDKLPAAQQVEILKWAEQHQIKPDETLWLLVDLMGYTKFMTETLPSQMRSAGQQAVEAIAQQRRAEADAFSINAQKALTQMLTQITARVATASENITEVKLRKKLWCHGLWVASGISVLSGMCFVFGYTFGRVHLPWIEQYSNNEWLRIAQVVLGLPIGYLIIPIILTAAGLVLIDQIAKWREQRHGW